MFERHLYTPRTYVKRGHPWRLRIEHDPDYGLTVLANECVTSEGRHPAILDGGAQFDVTEDEVRWLHRELGALIARLDAPPPPERIAAEGSGHGEGNRGEG